MPDMPDALSLWLAVLGGIIVGAVGAGPRGTAKPTHVFWMLTLIWVAYFGLTHLNRLVIGEYFDEHFSSNVIRYLVFMTTAVVTTRASIWLRFERLKNKYSRHKDTHS